jgi:hypothetical protein
MQLSFRANPRTPMRRQLRFEQLEARRPMAITTSLTSFGDLHITGDQDSDDFAIVGTGTPGEISVVGRNGTSIDGVVNGRTVVQGVTGSLWVEMETGDNVVHGNNIVHVDNLYVNGLISIGGGDGTDQVIFGQTGVVSAAENCLVGFGAGGNDLFLAANSNVFIAEALTVSSGSPLSTTLIGASARAISLIGSFRAPNNILVRGVTSAGPIHIAAVAPVNNIAIFNSSALAEIAVVCHSGQNSIYIDTCYSARFIAARSFTDNPFKDPTTPPGPASHNTDATITIARCQSPQIIVKTDDDAHAVFVSGNDRLFVYANNIVGPSFAGQPRNVIHVETGLGNDEVIASYNVAKGDASFSLGPQDDRLVLAANLITGAAIGEGGLGTNRLDLFFNQFGASAFTNFLEPSVLSLRPTR